jgi:hypothetical protein
MRSTVVDGTRFRLGCEILRHFTAFYGILRHFTAFYGVNIQHNPASVSIGLMSDSMHSAYTYVT